MDTVSDADWSRQTRRGLTLDVGLRSADPARDVVLSSPDVRLLKLASPELERLVLQQYSLSHRHQQQEESSKDCHLTFSVVATDEYAREFADAVLDLHAQRQTDGDLLVGGSTTVTTSATSLQTLAAATSSVVYGTPHLYHAVTAGPGSDRVTFSDTPPMSPANLARPSDDERSRLELKRQRNRLAATRCRNRKLERIEQLQKQADRLRAVNAKLVGEVNQLRETVNQLRQDLLLHADCQLAPLGTSAFESTVRYFVTEPADRSDLL